MKMTYPFSDYGSVLRLTRTIKEFDDGMSVDDAASSLGLNPQTANFKYQILAARLLGFIIRQGNILFATKLGRRFVGPDRKPEDIEFALSRVPAFSNLPKVDTAELSDQVITASLLAAEVPEARVPKTMRFYKDLVAAETPSDGTVLSGKPIRRMLTRPKGIRPIDSSESSVSASQIVVSPPAATVGSNVEPNDIWLMKDDAFKALLAKGPTAQSGWSEARRENYIACIGALLRELLWTDE